MKGKEVVAKKIKLTVEERILLLSILPSAGDYKTLKSVIDLRDSLIFDGEETAKFDIHQGAVVTVNCNDCGSSAPTLEPPNALDGKYECGVCGSFNTSHYTQNAGQMQITFNREVSEGYTKEIKFGIYSLNAIVAKLASLNDTGTLTEQILPLYEKFVI